MSGFIGQPQQLGRERHKNGKQRIKTARMIKINKVLVANRGEIALRIFRTLHEMGIASVAVYSESDKESLHSGMADERQLLKGKELSETYLNIDQLINLAREYHADAIHPGYGFLSENPLFAQAAREAGLVFIGPGEEAIRLMGNKREARLLASSLGIPVIEGVSGSPEELAREADRLGYPLLVKAAAGGGGKGMRIVHAADALHEVMESTSREAQAYFGDGEVYLEKFLDTARHIEVQLLADQHGQVISLYERECSLQRRHQKIIEEAPAPNLPEDLRKRLCEAAKTLARHIGYSSAGTVEFLVQDDSFFFLEMNTRIQVEHPVTEMITGVDMVKEQLHVAAGKPLRIKQEDVTIRGHAIEARVYAEDPARDFMPSPGRVFLHKYPHEKQVRVDTSLGEQGEISPLYDPMVSKVIAHANNRETARKQLLRHLKNYVLLGVKSNLPFLVRLIGSDAFVRGQVHTESLPEMLRTGELQDDNSTDHEMLSIAFLFAKYADRQGGSSIWQEIGQWRLLPSIDLLIDKVAVCQPFIYHTARKMSVMHGKSEVSYRLIHTERDTIRMEVDGHVHSLYFHTHNGEMILQHEGRSYQVRPMRDLGRDVLNQMNENPVLEGESTILAPMHGKVVSVAVRAGDCLMKGDTIMILESMKMENKITATAKACVKSVMVKAGDMVEDSSQLVILTDQLP